MLREVQKEEDNGVYFVPAFGGLFSPYFRADTTGLMVGLTHHSRP